MTQPVEIPHQPVLLESVLELLNPHAGEAFLDGTAGYGSHARPVRSTLAANMLNPFLRSEMRFGAF